MNERAKPELKFKPVSNESGIESTRFTPRRTWKKRRLRHGRTAGRIPFTRGIHRLMYASSPGPCASTRASIRRASQRFKYLIANGQTGLNVAFDLPTQIGLDRRSAGRWRDRRVGMSIDTLRTEVAFTTAST
jgi:methylmalonyl-CoA mutase N-terminal domain/subunit